MNWINHMPLAKKLCLGIAAIIVLFSAVSIFQIERTRLLGTLQDEGAKGASTAIALQEVQVRVESLAGIIGDAVINRDLVKSLKELQEAKAAQMRGMLLPTLSAQERRGERGAPGD